MCVLELRQCSSKGRLCGKESKTMKQYFRFNLIWRLYLDSREENSNRAEIQRVDLVLESMLLCSQLCCIVFMPTVALLAPAGINVYVWYHMLEQTLRFPPYFDGFKEEVR